MKGESIVIIPKSQENEASEIDAQKTWLQLAQSLVSEQGAVIHREKNGSEYLCLQCNLTPSQKSEISHLILSIQEYFNYGFESSEP